MPLLTLVFTLLFYVATAVFFFGLSYRIYRYAKTPAPLRIPLMPAPRSYAGVAWRLFKEVILFKSLFKANKPTWLFGWCFHAALVFILLRHLHYFFDPAPLWMYQIQTYSRFAASVMMLGLLGLWGRRLLVDRVRYISAPSDHLMLALIIALGATGMAMKYTGQTNLFAVKEFIRGLLYFDSQALPADWLLCTHLGLLAGLMIIFPFSKLLHAPGVFFSPTLHQRDKGR